MTTENSFLRLPQVIQITALSRSTIYDHMDQGTFPKQFKIGPRAAGWLASDIQKWIDGRISGSALK
jgi:prophage regulatory protein